MTEILSHWLRVKGITTWHCLAQVPGSPIPLSERERKREREQKDWHSVNQSQTGSQAHSGMPRDGRKSGPLDPGDGSGQSQATPPVDNAEVLFQGPEQLSLHCGGAERKARDIRNNLAGTNMSRRGWLQASPTVLRRQVSVSGSTAGTSSTHRDDNANEEGTQGHLWEPRTRVSIPPCP